jgi:hypothetical protein
MRPGIGKTTLATGLVSALNSALQGLTHLRTGTRRSPYRETVLRELIASIDMHDGRLVQPRFRLPGAVRTRSVLADRRWEAQALGLCLRFGVVALEL